MRKWTRTNVGTQSGQMNSCLSLDCDYLSARHKAPGRAPKAERSEAVLSAGSIGCNTSLLGDYSDFLEKAGRSDRERGNCDNGKCRF